MTYKRSGRRKLLKSAVAGGGAIFGGMSLPQSWSKPVIKSLVLPAHALTSLPDQAMTSSSDQPMDSGPECCLTEDTFCYTISGSNILFITVTEDGSVDILIQTSGGNWMATTSVPCFGGNFEVTAVKEGAAPDDTIGVTGTIICEQTSIQGTTLFPRADNPSDYTATPNSCTS